MNVTQALAPPTTASISSRSAVAGRADDGSEQRRFLETKTPQRRYGGAKQIAVSQCKAYAIHDLVTIM
jgi:hypothetical protein